MSNSRCGSVTGTRVPMRMTSTWSMAASSSRNKRSLPMRQRQRVAAGDDHVADLGMLADVLDHPLVVVADRVPAAAVHGRALARAEPAVHGADVRGDQQRPVGIAVRQAGDRRVLVFFERVFQLDAGGARLLERRGHRLQADRDRADRRGRSARSSTAGSPACTSLRGSPGRQVPGGRRRRTRPVEQSCGWRFASANASRPTVRRGRRSILRCRRVLLGGSSFSSGNELLSGAAMEAASKRFMFSESLHVETSCVHSGTEVTPVHSPKLACLYHSIDQDRQAGSGAKPHLFARRELFASVRRQLPEQVPSRRSRRANSTRQTVVDAPAWATPSPAASLPGPRASTMIGATCPSRRHLSSDAAARDSPRRLSHSQPGPTHELPCPAAPQRLTGTQWLIVSMAAIGLCLRYL